MQIIAGIWKGKKLTGPSTHDVRPTPGKVKGAIFSILSSRIQGAQIADLYAGTGAVGIEALSRGASHASFVESNPTILKVLRHNLAQCHLESQAAVLTTSVDSFLRNPTRSPGIYDIIFADPPYRIDPSVDLLPSLATSVTIGSHTLVLLEHSRKTVVPQQVGPLQLVRQYRYGDTALALYQSHSDKADNL